MTDEPLSLEQEERDAIRRIAGTRDGALLHRYFRRVLEEVIVADVSGALRAHQGRRTLARDLMRLMAEGIDEHRSDTDDPILARTRGAVSVARTRGRRDPSRYPRVDSYADDAKPDGTDASSGAAK